MKLGSWLVEKLNPSQRYIAQDSGEAQSLEPASSYISYFETLEIVNRGVNILIDDASEISFTVGIDKVVPNPTRAGLKRKTVDNLLNYQPNPYQDLNSFKRNIMSDLILDGNIFLYFDGQHIYHLPAGKVVVVPDEKTYVAKYTFDGRIDYDFDEIIHIKDNSSRSMYRGISRLRPALRTMRLMSLMRDFQDNFFKNGAVPGLVIRTDDVLSQRIKDRMKQDWKQAYRPQSGGKNPMILDGGMTIDPISKVNFQELDFGGSIDTNEKTILKALGVPPILIDSGNNANIRPNHRVYYLETVVPMVQKIASAFQAFFGFEIFEDLTGVPALQPELRDEAAYWSTLVNGGIATPDEARVGMGMEPLPEGGDKIRIPANVAGSAVDPSQGGRPPQGEPK